MGILLQLNSYKKYSATSEVLISEECMRDARSCFPNSVITIAGLERRPYGFDK